MANKRKAQNIDPVLETLKDILIAQLGASGVPQLEIRQILGVDVHRVNRIVKPIRKALKARRKNME